MFLISIGGKKTVMIGVYNAQRVTVFAEPATLRAAAQAISEAKRHENK